MFQEYNYFTQGLFGFILHINFRVTDKGILSEDTERECGGVPTSHNAKNKRGYKFYCTEA